jgi:DegV family protein with EDD domain
MAITRIVTDSSAELDTATVEQFHITVVPLHVQVGQESVADGPDLRSVEFSKRMVRGRLNPTILAATPRQLADVYARLAQETNEIVSLHLAARFNTTVLAAQQGRQGLLGRCHIEVLDTQFISRALGILVVEAAQAAQQGANAAEIVRFVRGLLPRMYLVFYVETLDYLKRNGLVQPPRASIGAPPTVKPLLMVEEGQIAVLQRLRSRGKPSERLFEFAAEFSHLQQIAILRSGVGPDAAELRALLETAFPPQLITEHLYGPALGAAIGPMALGLVAYEG